MPLALMGFTLQSFLLGSGTALSSSFGCLTYNIPYTAHNRRHVCAQIFKPILPESRCGSIDTPSARCKSASKFVRILSQCYPQQAADALLGRFAFQGRYPMIPTPKSLTSMITNNICEQTCLCTLKPQEPTDRSHPKERLPAAPDSEESSSHVLGVRM